MLRNAFKVILKYIGWLLMLLLPIHAYSTIRNATASHLRKQVFSTGSVLWRFSGIERYDAGRQMDTWNGETQQATKAVASHINLLPVDAAPPDLTVVSCFPSLRANLGDVKCEDMVHFCFGEHVWQCNLTQFNLCDLQNIFHVNYMITIWLSENLKYLRRLSTTRIEEKWLKILKDLIDRSQVRLSV